MSEFPYLEQIRKVARERLDPQRATIDDEMDAIEHELAEIARFLVDIDTLSPSERASVVVCARGALGRALQHSQRAKQIARGVRLTKA